MTLGDANILIDIWSKNPKWFKWSSQAFAKCLAEGDVAVNPIICAELSLGFPSQKAWIKHWQPPAWFGWICRVMRPSPLDRPFTCIGSVAERRRPLCQTSSSEPMPPLLVFPFSREIPLDTEPTFQL
tara:strand:- start:696 stop:1076 length:381 start_codon:yes stop_codon:yes gene_type:complete